VVANKPSWRKKVHLKKFTINIIRLVLSFGFLIGVVTSGAISGAAQASETGCTNNCTPNTPLPPVTPIPGPYSPGAVSNTPNPVCTGGAGCVPNTPLPPVTPLPDPVTGTQPNNGGVQSPSAVQSQGQNNTTNQTNNSGAVNNTILNIGELGRSRNGDIVCSDAVLSVAGTTGFGGGGYGGGFQGVNGSVAYSTPLNGRNGALCTDALNNKLIQQVLDTRLGTMDRCLIYVDKGYRIDPSFASPEDAVELRRIANICRTFVKVQAAPVVQQLQPQPIQPVYIQPTKVPAAVKSGLH
jgi:hypothetical protein